ncbi:MAG: bifunctional nuclease family protein [Candidatus Limimorpha sp.]
MNKILLEIIRLSYSNSQSGAYALILGCNESNLQLPIIIGGLEAKSIAAAIERHVSKRPLTHDLFVTFAKNYGISIKQVIINDFKEGIFFSKIVFVKDGEESIIDARPSDAVALAIRFNCPILTNPIVIEEAGININDIDTNEEDEEDEDEEDEEIFYPEKNELERFDNATLKQLLKDAIEKEEYEIASKINEEINKRKHR